MRERIQLTYPSTHTDEEIQYLFDEYRKKFPDRFREWVEIEKTFTNSNDDPLREIHVEGLRFLQDFCEYDSTFALGSAWFDLRTKVVEFAKAH